MNTHITSYLNARPQRAGVLLKRYAGDENITVENINIASSNLDFVKELYLDYVDENEVLQNKSISWEQFKEWFNTGAGLIDQTNQLLNPDTEFEKTKSEIEERNNNMMWIGFIGISLSIIIVLFALLKK